MANNGSTLATFSLRLVPSRARCRFPALRLIVVAPVSVANNRDDRRVEGDFTGLELAQEQGQNAQIYLALFSQHKRVGGIGGIAGDGEIRQTNGEWLVTDLDFVGGNSVAESPGQPAEQIIFVALDDKVDIEGCDKEQAG